MELNILSINFQSDKSGCFDFHNVKRCQILASHSATLLSQVYDSTLNLILKWEKRVRRGSQVYYRVGTTREQYFVNIANNKRSAAPPWKELLFF